MKLLEDGTVRVNSSKVLYGHTWAYTKAENRPFVQGLREFVKMYNEGKLE